MCLCWPGSVGGWAGSVWGHCAPGPPPPSCSPPRRGEGLPGTRPALWMCRPGWRTGALPPEAEDCGTGRGTGEDGSGRERSEEKSGTEASLRFSLTWRFDGCSRGRCDLGRMQNTVDEHVWLFKEVFKQLFSSSYKSLPCFGRLLMYMKSLSSSLSGNTQGKSI